MHVHAAILALGAAVLSPSPAATQDFQADRNATVDAAGATSVEIVAKAGRLRVRGIEGRTDVRVKGVARTSEEDWLDEIRLVAERRGNVVYIEARIPSRSCTGFCWGNWHQSLDLDIEVPKGMAARVEDSSGDADIFDVGDLDVEDSSGDLEIEGAGRLRVRDSSGEIRITRITGDVTIDDNSGDIIVRSVTGSVLVDDDSSGEIDISDVSGTVRVRDDGSGSIDVRSVGGDFIVDDDGSGSITYRDVKGKVDIPKKERRRRDRDRDW